MAAQRPNNATELERAPNSLTDLARNNARVGNQQFNSGRNSVVFNGLDAELVGELITAAIAEVKQRVKFNRRGFAFGWREREPPPPSIGHRP
jgi:hypothetical protein